MEYHCSGRDLDSNYRYEGCVKSILDEYRYDADAAVQVHEVHIEVRFEFIECNPNAIIPDNVTIDDYGGWWFDVDEYPDELDGFRGEVKLSLERALMCLEPIKRTMRMIFDGILGDYLTRRGVKEVIRLFGSVKTTVDRFESESEEEEMYEEVEDDDEDVYEDDEEMYEEEDDEGAEPGRVLQRSMEEEDFYLRPTPARREAVEALEKVTIRGVERESSCFVCSEEFSLGSTEATKMPCWHIFHQDCLTRWLKHRSFCPLCKYELPTADDP